MLAILSAVIGFAAPFLPEVLKYFRMKAEMKHEKELMQLRLQQGAAEHGWRMEEIAAQADIEEARVLHTPAPSFGVQMLDAAKDHRLGNWAVIPAFYLFTLLDFVAGMVRPTVTYAVLAFYMAFKLSSYEAMRSVSDETFKWWEGVNALWTEQDWAVLTLVLSYWFGHRAAKAAFGGSASTAKAGA
jgi:hypothetical protein